MNHRIVSFLVLSIVGIIMGWHLGGLFGALFIYLAIGFLNWVVVVPDLKNPALMLFVLAIGWPLIFVNNGYIPNKIDDL